MPIIIDSGIDFDDDPVPAQAEPLDRGERSLWANVLHLALCDVQNGDPYALRWMNDPEGSFPEVCEFLGLNVGQVRNTIERQRDCGQANTDKYSNKRLAFRSGNRITFQEQQRMTKLLSVIQRINQPTNHI